MCGIVAFFARRHPVSESALTRATESLHHRGPDGQRHWMSPDRMVGLGHARLSIIDLTTGDQPIASEDGRTRIVVNGEFYGYEAIQRELEARGHHLRTRSDSEIALHLYEDFGAQCLHHLRGEFAFVLWDEHRRTIFAARDRFGIKPLFYAWHQDTLYFASEAKALFAAGVPARWDDGERVQLGGVRRAPGAHVVRRGPPDPARPPSDRDRQTRAGHQVPGTSTTPWPARRATRVPMPITWPSSATNWRSRCASACARTCPWACI